MIVLTRRKCVKILNFYKKNTRGVSLPTLRQRATRILHEKMCKCVNALYKGKGRVSGSDAVASRYSRAVAICKNSVYTKKKISPAPKFSCKNKKV
jgi:hypothetical protein